MTKIDIYLFINDNYPRSRTQLVDFGELDKTKDINKGIIRTLNDINRNYISYYNLDYIISNNVNNKYYSYYLNNKPKDKQKYRISQDNINNFKVKMYKCLEILQSNYDKYNKLCNNLQSNLQSNLLNTSGFVLKLNVKETDKIIMFGDYHGSYHTLFKNLLRLHIMGCIDLPTYKIKDGYKIVFLGDLVDRGNYCFEILDLLFNFIINNEEYKIIINRGNHEEMIQNSVDGFRSELKAKAPEEYKTLHSIINCLFSYCPTAIILNKDNQKIWLCHGLISTSDNFIENINNFLKSDCNLLQLTERDAYEIRWNDTPNINNITQELNTDNIYSRRSIDNNIFNVGTNTINKFLEIFDLIIRGHEDSYSNAWLLKCGGKNKKFDLNKYINEMNDVYEVYGDNNNIKDENGNIKIYTTKSTNSTDIIKQIDRPIQTIKITNLKNNNIFKRILTISTNTCYGRNLNDDSFIVLRYNNDKLPSVEKCINNDNNINLWLKNINTIEYNKTNDEISKLTCRCNNTNSTNTNSNTINQIIKPDIKQEIKPKIIPIISLIPHEIKPKIISIITNK
jgi:hypothetical protein